MIKNMYGSIHTHFEDSYDAVNDINDAVLQFILQGAVKVAATGHGVFTEFEDIRDAVAEAKAKSDEVKKVLSDEGYELSLIRGEDDRLTPKLKQGSYNVVLSNSDQEIKSFVSRIGITDHLTQEDTEEILKHPDLAACYVAMVDEFEIIPGIEAYFGKNKDHMILIAKDYEGYQMLSKIISKSSEDYDNGPIVTLDNLKENVVTQGHLYCTSACIAGIFGRQLGLQELNLKEKSANLKKLLDEVKYDEQQRLVDEKARYKKVKKVTKADLTAAQRLIKKQEDYSLQEECDRKAALYEEAQQILTENAEKYAIAERVVKANTKRVNRFYSYQDELINIETSKEEEREYLKDLYYELESIFGKDNFFFELQNHGIDKEQVIYNELIKFAYEVTNKPHFIASNDIHICKPKGNTEEEKQTLEDAITKRSVAMFGRFNKYSTPTKDAGEYYIKTDEAVMGSLYTLIRKENCKETPEKIIYDSVQNIKNVLSACKVEFPEHQEHYPKFCDDENQMFDDLVEQGVKERFPNGLPEGYRERIDYEKGVIKEMGYAGYHLIVQDYLNYGRLLGYLTEDEIKDAPLTIEELRVYVKEKHPEGNLGIGIGPGRGSAGGSLCCYLLGITDVDPIKYGLLFERFLNVERVSMPDIDSDFRSDVRDKTYEYCMNKYGKDRVCKVMTKTYLAAKGAIRTAARYLGGRDSNEIENSFDEYVASLTMNASEIKEKKNEIKVQADGIKHQYLNVSEVLCKKYDEYAKNPKMSSAEIIAKLQEGFPNEISKDILSLSGKIENMFTVYGKHAAGVIISKDDISGIVPIMYDEKDKVFKTQCIPAQAEAKGLLKMDFLGLTNLAIITNIIRTKGKEDYNLQSPDSIARILGNKEIYEKIFATGLTHGVFQFESPGMKRMLQDFKPESFDDIVLLVAAYRPGPMDYIPEIIAQKWHEKDPQKYPAPKKSITLQNADLAKILEPTYGCPIYQEQIMKIFQDMAGYSLGGADVVRRYMSKKKVAKLAHEKHTFIYGDPDRGIPGCIAKQGITEKEADDLFEQMMPFAKYGFNKSHAVEYAIVSMFTAYLKYAHTADFYRCSMDAMDKTEKLIPYIEEAKEFGIKVLPPDIEKSENLFKVNPDNEKQIFYGFSNIKGIGSLDITNRTKNAEEFIKTNLNVSVKDITKLALLGLFDSFFGFDNEKKALNTEDVAKCVEKLGTDIRNSMKFCEDIEREQTEAKNLPAGSEERAEVELKIDDLVQKKDKLLTTYNNVKEKCLLLISKAKMIKEENYTKILDTEKELLGESFSVEDLRGRFKRMNPYEIAGLTFKKLAEKEKGFVTLPVVVVDGGENNEGQTKGGQSFHSVKLMDTTGKIIERRYREPIHSDKGWLSVYVDSQKWFVNDRKITNVAPDYIRAKCANVNQEAAMRSTADGYYLLGNDIEQADEEYTSGYDYDDDYGDERD